MEFSFLISKVLKLDQDEFCILEGRSFTNKTNSYTTSYLQTNTKFTNKPSFGDENIAEIIDKMGEASSIAQGLKTIITTFGKFMGSDHKLYIKAEGKNVLGILKIGSKNLFYRDHMGIIKELKPLCVLDFYVHESVQRGGIGKFLFDKMLENENITPEKLAYDKPSPKLIAFLKKHYGLVNYIPQNNNFVIFNQFWNKSKTNSNESNDQHNSNLLLLPSLNDNTRYDSKKYPHMKLNNQSQQSGFLSVGRRIIESNIGTNDSIDTQQIPQTTLGITQIYSSNNDYKSSLNPGRSYDYKRGLDNFPNDLQLNSNRNLIYHNDTEYTNDSNPYRIQTRNNRLAKEELNFANIQNKLKANEIEISKYKEKVNQLGLENSKPIILNTLNHPYYDNTRNINLKTPWAITSSLAKMTEFSSTQANYKNHFKNY